MKPPRDALTALLEDAYREGWVDRDLYGDVLEDCSLVDEDSLWRFKEAFRPRLDAALAAVDAEPTMTTELSQAVREARNALAEQQCEGWCKENGGRGKFADCCGCTIAARLDAALAAVDAEPVAWIEDRDFAKLMAGHSVVLYAQPGPGIALYAAAPAKEPRP